MVNLLAYTLIRKIIQANEAVLKDSTPRFIGRQNEKGEVIYGEKHFEYIGLTDKKGNYFYVRYANNNGKEVSYSKKADLIDPRYFSYVVGIPLRMVFVFSDLSTEYFHLKILNDLIGLDLATFDRRRTPIIELDGSSTNYETIYKEETGKDIKGWSGAVKLIAFDLTLKVNIDYESCQQFSSLCEDISYCQFEEAMEDCTTMDQLLTRLNILKNG